MTTRLAALPAPRLHWLGGPLGQEAGSLAPLVRKAHLPPWVPARACTRCLYVCVVDVCVPVCVFGAFDAEKILVPRARR